MNPTTEQIAARAYQRFLERGGEHGHDLEDWVASERELSPYDVVLLDRGSREIELLRVLRELTGMGLRELQFFLEDLPRPIKRASNRSAAEAMLRSLETAGAKVELQPAER